MLPPMSSVLKTPPPMTLAEFLAWDAPDPCLWQLIDGEPVAMAPPSRTHGAIQSELGRLIGNHLAVPGNPCTVVMTPGIIPRVRFDENFRVPDLAVTCTGYEMEEYDVSNPVLIAEILSPSNKAETWRNIWAFTTIPSLREILILNSVSVRAEVLRRDADGAWPREALVVEEGDLILESIGLTVPLKALYRATRLARG